MKESSAGGDWNVVGGIASVFEVEEPERKLVRID